MANKLTLDLTFHVNPAYPEQTLERCGYQIDLLADLIGGSGECNLSDSGLTGLCGILRSVSAALCEVQELVQARRSQARA